MRKVKQPFLSHLLGIALVLKVGWLLLVVHKHTDYVAQIELFSDQI